MTQAPEFDIYPDLERDMRNAEEQSGHSLEEVAAYGLEEVLSGDRPNDETKDEKVDWQDDSELGAWARPELEHALEGWKLLEGAPGTERIPESLEELAKEHTSFLPTLRRLHQAKESIKASEGEIIADSLHLVIIPWQAILENLPDLNGWLGKLRKIQGLERDQLQVSFTKAFEENLPIYRNTPYRGKLNTAEEYLREKIRQDGPAGIMLMQTEGEPGTPDTADRPPDLLTDSGAKRWSIDGWPVDSMGIFEWLSLTLQEEARELGDGYSLLLANRIESSDSLTVLIPLGHIFDQKQVITTITYSKGATSPGGPRLAVA